MKKITSTLSLFLLIISVGVQAHNIEGKSIKVLDSHIFYREGGEGSTVLFIHGAPTSSFLWRNILPTVAKTHHVLAIDLIGHGRSGKPFIEYRFVDHMKYLNAFIEAMELEDITLVLHDFGTAIGFNYAAQHPHNVKAIAFMEAMFGPVPDASLMPDIAIQMRGANGWDMIVNQNFFLENMLPMMSMLPLDKKILAAYKKPFDKIQHRRALLAWPREVPIKGQPEDTHLLFSNYASYLTTTKLPKLLVYSTPGVLTGENQVYFAEHNFHNLKSVNVGPGLHFMQEEHPAEVANALSVWLNEIEPAN